MAADLQLKTAVGVIDNNSLEWAIGGLTEFAGVPVDETSILCGYTWAGDVNLDGIVNSSDYDRIDSNWLNLKYHGITPEGGFRWAVGDLNYDGGINSSDYDLIDRAWLLSKSAPLGGDSAPAPAAVDALPEAGLAAAAAGELSTAAPQDATAGEDEALPSLDSEMPADPASAGGRAAAFGPDSVTARRVVSDTGIGAPAAPPPVHAVAATADAVFAADGAVDLLAAAALEIALGHSLT